MKARRVSVLAWLLVASLLCVAGAPVPRLVKFSGFVQDAGGNPRTGVTSITFALYEEQEGGAALWLETQNVTLDQQGRYTVLLGANSAEGIPLEAFSANEARWLGVQPEGLPEQRVLLVSVPYALKAAEADSLGGRPASSYVLATTGGAPAASSTSAVPQDATCATPPCPVVTPGGTANMLAMFQDATTVQNSPISENACPGTGQPCIGINNANPLRTLDVNGEIRLGGGNIFMQRDLTDQPGRRNWAWGTETFNVGDVSLFVSSSNVGYASISPVFTALSNSNMGIGVATPTARLEVLGNVKVSGAGNALIFPDGTMRTSAISINGTLSVSGPVQITTPGQGIIVKSPDGTWCEQIGIDNTGKIYTPNVSCPYPLAILTTSLSSATVGTAYDQVIGTSGGNGTAITFVLANSTTLPAWASLNPATGHITGTPAAGDAGTSAPFQIRATQPGSTVISENLSILTVDASNCAGAPTGHESMLNGQYAFLVQGFDSGGAFGRPVAIAASFHADGAGNVSGGDFDINNAAGATHATINAGSYTVGLDPTSSGNLGCVALSLSNGSTAVFRFSLGGLSSGVFSKGRIIEFDDTTGLGSRGSGVLLRQDTTSFSLSHLQPHYAFGVDGVDYIGYHFASAGSFTVDTSGNISNAFGDTSEKGQVGTSETTGGTGTINAISSTTGRATMSLPLGGQTTHQAIYMVSADEFFMIGTDPLGNVPIYGGRAIVTASSFSQSSLSGNYIIHTTATSAGLCMQLSGGVEYYVPCTEVNLWLVNANSGALSGTLYFYVSSPAHMIPAPFSGVTYAVDATSGRTTTSSTMAPISYIATPTATTEPIFAFSVGPDANAEFGFVEFQPSQTYSNGALAGNYFAGTEDPGDETVTDEIGVVNISSGGTVTGGGYASGEGGVATTSPSGTVSIGSNGVGTMQYSPYGCPYNYVAITNGTRLFTILDGGVYCNGVPVFRPAVVTVYERQ